MLGSVTKTYIENFEDGTESKENSNTEKETNLTALRKQLKKERNKWFNTEDFSKFFHNSIKYIIYVTIYFYIGVNFSLLSKNVQSYGGLRGQDINGAPYMGNFSECNDKTTKKDTMSTWSFPYKNDAICDAEANKKKPFYFRIITWTTSVIAFSYAMGRKIFGKFLRSESDTTMILLGPLITIWLLLFTPVVGWFTTLVGLFINYSKLLPACYMQFWFPIITHIVFFLGFLQLPISIALQQFFTMLYYLLFHITFNKVEILENGSKTVSHGMPTIFSRIIKNSLYLLLILLIVAYQSYNYLGLGFSIVLSIAIAYTLITKLFNIS
jgi:hypothetical protein